MAHKSCIHAQRIETKLYSFKISKNHSTGRSDNQKRFQHSKHHSSRQTKTHLSWFTFISHRLVSNRWQRAIHTVSKERGGDYRAVASCQGVLREGWKRVKEGGFDWWMVWECHGVVINNCQCLPMHPSLVFWGTVSCISKPVFICFF